MSGAEATWVALMPWTSVKRTPLNCPGSLNVFQYYLQWHPSVLSVEVETEGTIVSTPIWWIGSRKLMLDNGSMTQVLWSFTGLSSVPHVV